MQMMAKTANFKDQIIILFSICTAPIANTSAKYSSTKSTVC